MEISKSLPLCGALIICLVAVPAVVALEIEFVEIGDPGNPPNTIIKTDGSSGYGAIAYTFRMSKYETTNEQYAEFLNAVATTDTYGLYDTAMAHLVLGGIERSGAPGNYTYTIRPNMGNKPVSRVSWYDCARFANWMHNGQPKGLQNASTTEDGAYTFGGLEVISGRNPGALYFMPDEHEWDKAAYYEAGASTWMGANGLGEGWWRKTSASDTIRPTPATVDEFGNVTNPGRYIANIQQTANWNGSTQGNVVTVGSSGNISPYGVADMTGNVFEWTIADPTKPDPNGWGPYMVMGGSYFNVGHSDISERNLEHHDNHNIVAHNVGFRLAAAALEPLLADFNDDSFVDGNDLTVWQQSYGVDATGDANGDGVTDGRDFLIWQQEFSPGSESPEITSAVHVNVPEPGALVMVVACAGLSFCRRRLV